MSETPSSAGVPARDPQVSASRDACATDLAARTVAALFAGDRASQMLGMEVIETGPGRSAVRMTVRADMLNGFGIIHGGLTFALADTALAFACNSDGELAVASGASIDWLAPAREGDVLTATAREVSRTKRTGVYDIEVANQHGARIAVFRGRAHVVVGKPSVPDAGAPDEGARSVSGAAPEQA